ncbi:hypothetical protein BAE44_0015836 [Dichanthelium oligosanthes]|uniref:Uncharacterized protein n=1 Tax=Dichanthelium oligosanthes TaxID=888268 RepID=A0A1E5VDC0_9POAL|nr:hypothetical protein BAE44_0015836 [Dichanthelium oligosanthes]
MSTPGSRARSAGLAVMMLFVSAGIHSGADGFGLLPCFAGLLAGVGIHVVGVRMAEADNPAPIVPAVFDGARALAAFLRGNLTVVGLVMASCAVTVVSGKAGPVLCFGMHALLLFGLSLINIGVLGK